MSIAVIVPAYNAEKYIKQCINSVKRQTFSKWKLIIVDDGSSDSTYKIAKEYADADDRISILHQCNQGSINARKNGVNCKIAQQCDYITFLDADDELYPECLQILYTEIREYDADMAVGNIRRMINHYMLWKHYDFSCMEIEKPRYYTHSEVVNELLYGYYGPVVFPVVLYGKLYTRHCITEAINTKSIVKFMGDDLSVTIRAVVKSNIVVIPIDVYKYRIGGGTSKYQPSMLDDFLALYKLKQSIALEYEIPQDWKYTMDKELLAITQSCIQQCINVSNNNTYITYEVRKICSEPMVQDAAMSVLHRDPDNAYARMIERSCYEELIQFNMTKIKKRYLRKRIKNILMNIWVIK